MTVKTGEVLADGQAIVEQTDDDPDQLRVRGVLIGEGDISTGLSGKPTRWPGDVLEAAAESGVFEGKPITIPPEFDPEQHVGVRETDDGLEVDKTVSLNDKVGEIEDTWFEAGTGLLFEGFVADPESKDLVQRGLAQISPVMMRSVEPADADDVQYEELYDATGVQWVRDVGLIADGGMPSNSIEAMGVAALQSHFPADDGSDSAPDGDQSLPDRNIKQPTADQPAVEKGITDALEALQDVDPDDSIPDVGDAVRWESDAGGENEPDSVRYGVVVDGLQDEADNRVLVAVYEPSDDGDGWENRGEENPMDGENLEVVGPDGVESLPPVDQVANAAAPPVPDRIGSATIGAESPVDSDFSVNQSMSDTDLTERQKEVLRQANNYDDPQVVGADDAEALQEYDALLDAAAETDDPEVVDNSEIEALAEFREVFKQLRAERDGVEPEALRDDPEVLTEPFRNDDGDLDVSDLEALGQAPETGGDPDDVDTVGSLDDDDREEIESLAARAETFDGVDADHAEALRSDAAEIAGVDDFETVETEVLE